MPHRTSAALRSGRHFLLRVALSVAAAMGATLAGCGHGPGSVLPGVTTTTASKAATTSAVSRQTQSVGSGDIIAINAGGPAAGNFVADTDFNGGQTSSTSAAIDVSATNAAPAAVYQTQRYGQMSYTIPGLTPGASYDVRLHFAETYFGLDGRPGPKSRRFNVMVNGTTTLKQFDIYAAAGAANTAVVRDVTATATSAGKIVIEFLIGYNNLPAINGIEILPTAVVQPADVAAINVGGPAVGSFAADVDGVGGTVSTTTDNINVSNIANAAPEAVYQTQRVGPMTYTIPGLTPGTNYDVRLHFAETYFGLSGRAGAGQRRFNVYVNGTIALREMDVYAAAGAADTAVVRDSIATATSAGTIVISLQTGYTNQPVLNGIEILPPPAPVPATAISVGGGGTGSFVADVDGAGGATESTLDSVNVGVENAAPQAVYQTQRFGPMTYTIPGFTAGGSYVVRLHFSEMYFGADNIPGGIGSREFNVAINGTNVLSNLDVYARAGGANKALVIDTPATADSSGTFTIALTNGAASVAILDGIQILSPAASVNSETPGQSDAFVDSIGINTHLSNFSTLYANFSKIKSLLVTAGIRHIRDGSPSTNASLCKSETTFPAADIHMDLVAGDSMSDLSSGLSCLGATAESIEGLNEPDLNEGANWVSITQANTAALAAAYPQFPLIAPSVTTIQAEQSLGSLASLVQYGNTHAYFAGRNPGNTGWGADFPPYGVYGTLAYVMGIAGIVSGTAPVDIAESGYSDALDTYTVPAVTKARYTLRTLLLTWNAGVPKTYLYELIDEGPTPFSHYGITDSSGNPKPVYFGIESLLQHLSDPGGSFSVTPLHYNLYAPATVQHTLLEKRNGTYELVFWNEVPEWDPNANATIATTPVTVTLTFLSTPSAIKETTFADSGNVTTATLPSAVEFTLNASAWPTIVDITP